MTTRHARQPEIGPVLPTSIITSRAGGLPYCVHVMDVATDANDWTVTATLDIDLTQRSTIAYMVTVLSDSYGHASFFPHPQSPLGPNNLPLAGMNVMHGDELTSHRFVTATTRHAGQARALVGFEVFDATETSVEISIVAVVGENTEDDCYGYTEAS